MLGRDDAAVLVRDASSFTGGAGAADSSAASAPKGPSGPIESSRLSSVVDWARLPYRRGVRDLEGAGFALVAVAGEEGSWDVVGGDACSERRSAYPWPPHIYRGRTHPFGHRLPPWLGYDSSASARGHLQRKVNHNSTPRLRILYASALPSHGDPSSSIPFHGLSVVLMRSIAPAEFGLSQCCHPAARSARTSAVRTVQPTSSLVHPFNPRLITGRFAGEENCSFLRCS